ncbi:hypothetical protein V2J09_008650 [Rumex salicifolius]
MIEELIRDERNGDDFTSSEMSWILLSKSKTFTIHYRNEKLIIIIQLSKAYHILRKENKTSIKGINLMYHHHHQNQVKSMYSTPSMHVHPERQLFLQGGNGPNSSLVLSTDAKPRLKWTPELHDRFTEAVNQLGGAEKATPKTVMKLMGIPGLTLYHLKSHLQKYRLNKNLHGGHSNSGISKTVAISRERTPETNGLLTSDNGIEQQVNNKNVQMSETLQMQIEVQRRLHEQLEVQRHLQLRIEAQGKYLHTILEKAQDTLDKQNIVGTAGLEDTKLQLSELVSKVSTQCLNLTFGGELQQNHRLLRNQSAADYSIDSCLTACEEHNELSLRHYQERSEEDENERLLFPIVDTHRRKETIAFPIGMASEFEKHQRGETAKVRTSVLSRGLDLNARDEADNGVSWT